jgi:OmpA-OmpF porin, OOP family
MRMSREIGFALIAAAMVLPLSSTAADAAAKQGVYVAGAFGLHMPTDDDTKLAGGQNTLEYDLGWAGTGAVGFAWGNGFRSEAELGYRQASINDITGTGNGPSKDGSMGVFTAMFNQYYDIHFVDWITPYIGAGIGYAHLDPDGIRQVVNGSTLQNSTGQFAYQGIAGLGFDLDRNWTLTADYRYLGTTRATFDTQAGSKLAQTGYHSHNIMFGVRYTFGEPVAVAQPAPAPKPMPVKQAARPAAPAVPQTYMVFFDFDRTDLTPEAERILASVANDYKKGKQVRIHVTGHADRSGKDKYNMNLSLKRAAMVKAELTRLGLDAGAIVTKGSGEAEPMIPTADGVREAQNRRAEIFLGDMQVKQ